VSRFTLRPDLEVRDFTPEDETGVQALLAADEDYFVAATGSPSAPGDVQSLFYSLPEGADLDAKRLLVVVCGGLVIGLVDVVLDYPEPSAAAVGLFFVHPDHRRQGVGDAVAGALINYARESQIHLVTTTTPLEWAPGRAFLEHLDFTVEAPEQARHQTSNRNLGPFEPPVLRAQMHLQQN